MEITDVTAASACLERIGYYRLSGYWYPFRKSRIGTNPLTGQALTNPVTRKPQVVVEDAFRLGTTFQQVMDLYVFDKRLRLHFLDAIERVEVALRIDIALMLGARNPWAHRDPAQLHGNFAAKIDPSTGQTRFHSWLKRLDSTFDRSKEEFVKHFKLKYAGEKLPIWIAIELWDFGMLSTFLSGMKIVDLQALAQKYGLPRVDLLTTWIRNINNVRNICAHHSRLWNRSPADQPSPPKPREISALDHLAFDKICSIPHLRDRSHSPIFLEDNSSRLVLGIRLGDGCVEFPTSSTCNLAQAGFAPNWEQQSLWN